MKRTPLYSAHLQAGARIVDFAGWEMPIQYTSILEEHKAVRRAAGLFDVSHMGDLIIRGEGAEDLLRRILTNDIKGFPIGKGMYGHLLDEQGRIIDDSYTFPIAAGQFLFIPNASTKDTVLNWMRKHARREEIIDVTDRLVALALQGPRSQEILQKLTDLDLSTMKKSRGEFVDIRLAIPACFEPTGFLTDLLPEELSQTKIKRGERCYITRTGYTGEDGFEILIESASGLHLWRTLLREGEQYGLVPAGLGARDLLRLEMGFLLSGTDFDGSQSTIQTGPPWVIKWSHDFIGKEAMLRQKEEGDYPVLVGLEVTGRGIPRHGYDIKAEGKVIGKVTSGTLSPCLKKGIAMGYVDQPHQAEGTNVVIAIRDNEVPAVVVKPPFIKKGVNS